MQYIHSINQLKTYASLLSQLTDKDSLSHSQAMEILSKSEGFSWGSIKKVLSKENLPLEENTLFNLIVPIVLAWRENNLPTPKNLIEIEREAFSTILILMSFVNNEKDYLSLIEKLFKQSKVLISSRNIELSRVARHRFGNWFLLQEEIKYFIQVKFPLIQSALLELKELDQSGTPETVLGQYLYGKQAARSDNPSPLVLIGSSQKACNSILSGTYYTYEGFPYEGYNQSYSENELREGRKHGLLIIEVLTKEQFKKIPKRIQAQYNIHYINNGMIPELQPIYPKQ